MTRAVRFDHYGPVEVLQVVQVERPSPGAGEVLVEVVSAGINPGEIAIREGLLHDQWPATFPSGQGSDFAGRVVEVGAGVDGTAIGDEVLGFTDGRSSQADFVAAAAEHVVPKPGSVDWDQAGALKVAGTTAYAIVRAAAPGPGETVVISGAAGGVGTLATQLALRSGARVLGIAGEANAEWLRSIGVEPVSYGDGLAERLRAAAGGDVDVVLDTFGGGYVELAVDLGVPSERIITIIDFAAAAKFGTPAVGGAAASTGPVLRELADLLAAGDLTVPIAAGYPLEEVQEAYAELARRHTRGKIVLRLR